MVFTGISPPLSKCRPLRWGRESVGLEFVRCLNLKIRGLNMAIMARSLAGSDERNGWDLLFRVSGVERFWLLLLQPLQPSEHRQQAYIFFCLLQGKCSLEQQSKPG